MRRLLVLAVVGAVLALPTAATATIRPHRGMSGLWLGMTKAQVQGKLGRPIGTGGARFYYARVWVGFRAGWAVEITTTRPGERTLLGIGVDSSEAAVRRAYRIACVPWSAFRRCRLGSGKPGTRVTDFFIGGRGRVLQVTVALLPR
jgi:hypothetical protein